MIKGEFEFFKPYPQPFPLQGEGVPEGGEGVLIGKLNTIGEKTTNFDFIPLTSHVSVIMA